MVSTNTLRKSPAALAGLVAALVAALFVGGVSGYVIRGLGVMSGAQPSAASSSAAHESATSPYLYVQGGRPPAVYSQGRAAPSLYVQGDRPQVVYVDAAGIESQRSRN